MTKTFASFFQKYRIIYRVGVKSIAILAVIHGARDLGELDLAPWEIG